ncbi:hypothetical protein [Aquabacterium sp.]|uniref:hypothetical protein n=1 Tax=Aquabacterium sp. TaxID=1872578 RepID=UPI002E35B80E|nr:hypothetical protein [Aquabacterium sp.]HEX5313181.1 hypothetical protein [Aquabacterium sp.]
MDILVNAGAVAYGVTLVVATFVRHPLTEAMRIDALFIPQASERTRPLNLLMGVAIAGYGAWSLLSR